MPLRRPDWPGHHCPSYSGVAASHATKSPTPEEEENDAKMREISSSLCRQGQSWEGVWGKRSGEGRHAIECKVKVCPKCNVVVVEAQVLQA